MPTLGEQVQTNIRALTGTAGQWVGDWHALFDLVGLSVGNFGERLIAYYRLYIADSPEVTVSAALRYFLLNPSTIVSGYSYYRMRITAGGGSQYSAIAEWTLFNTQGGTDLTQGGTPTASSSIGSNYDAPKAFDKSTATLWVTQNALPSTLTYQFAAPTQRATWMTISGSQSDFLENPVNFVVEKSINGSIWVNAGTFSGVTWSSAGETKGFALT